ncbi:acyl-ACP--UDP-N-acetylglucosamine O-acyltransferase [Ghiorsea bivora]|uniref:acyl-ACP--UDP-N-acetylglucosamine O-acyltransferase n=1 Tax=Ghiorsea bivora TaxID=1485545 RepID=UPI0005711BDE|nr:acyl-ACP--UDP-N-acetylglucosamine O-acyltransferase [Ghiorsea bivora]
MNKAQATSIHPTAVVSDKASIGKGVSIGPFCTVDEGVTLGAGCELVSHVSITGRTTIGKQNTFSPFSSIGGVPQDLKFHDEPSEVIIGDNNTFREYVTVHRGTEGGGMLTKIGDNNLFQTYTHVAHDCQIGNGIVLACSAILAGHVEVHDGAIVGAMSAVHQFCRIGKNVMLGATCTVLKDMPPFTIAGGGYTMSLSGLNTVGLKRKGFSNDDIRALKTAYKMIFMGSGLLKDRLAEVEGLSLGNAYVDELIDFVRSSERGVMMHSKKDKDV